MTEREKAEKRLSMSYERARKLGVLEEIKKLSKKHHLD